LLQLSEAQKKQGVITSSGGNHGLAVAYAATRLGIPAIVYLPETASPDRVARARQWSAEIIRYGDVWDVAHAKAMETAASKNLHYIHPFDAPATIAGQGTLGLELLEEAPDVDCIVIAIGGGGLIAGVAAAVKQVKPGVHIIGVEPEGAPTMKTALTEGKVVQLPFVKTIADTLAPRSVSERTLAMTQKYVDEIVLVSDAEMIEGMQWLWKNYNQLVEPSGAAVIAALNSGRCNIDKYQNPVAIICGGNAAAEPIWSVYTEAALK
jgi:threonine dehydratase